MALNIPSYPNNFNPPSPLQNAYGWISYIVLDLSTNKGRFTLNINPNENAWQSKVFDQIEISLGQTLVPATPANPNATPPTEAVPAVTAKTLSELMEDPEFAAAFNTIGKKLYEISLKHQLLSESTII